MITRLALSLLVALITVAASPVPAQSPRTSHEAREAKAVMSKMVERNPALHSYTSRVHVNLRMLNFPFLAPQLDGTSYFKRPDKYEIVFDRVPGYAKGFEKLFNDVADPMSWEADSNVVDRGMVKVDAYPEPLIELYMTKKIYSTIIDNTIAYVDPRNYELLEMVWNYRSGGKIVMRQWYREQGPYSLVSQQHVEINIPHVRAVGDSIYATYQTNVAVSDEVFKR